MAQVTFALLTDFGAADGYVAAMKGVLLGLCPGASIIDISHQIDPQDIAHGALVLADVAPYLPMECVCLAVVDPGVGTERRALAITGGQRRQTFVGPDNGLLWPVVEAAGQRAEQAAAGQTAQRIHQITRDDYMLQPVSGTFHGRDIFAPVAAHLANGAPIDRVGPQLGEIERYEIPQPIIAKGLVCGQVIRVDHYGNLITSIRSGDIPMNLEPQKLTFAVGDVQIRGIQPSYGFVAQGELLATVGGFGRVEISLNGGSAASTLGIGKQMSVPVECRF